MMKNTAKIALLSCVAALTLGVAPMAQAVSVSSSTAASASASGGTSTTLTKQQLKQQKKLRKKCAKLNSGKLKASKRAALMAMCKTTSGTTEDSSKLSSTPANSNAGGNSSNSNAGGNSSNSNAGGNSSNSNAGGNSSNSNAGGNGPVIELIQGSPPLFVPALLGTEKTDDSTDSISELVIDSPNAVPEPGSLALLGLGLVGLGLARRRARR